MIGAMRREGERATGGEGVLLTALAIGVFAVSVAIQGGRIVSWDGRAMASVGQTIYLRRGVTECCNAFRAFPADHLKYSKFGIGLSLLLAPLWGAQLHTRPNGAIWLGLANPLVLGWRRSTAVLIGLAFALLTMAPNYSTEFFAEPGVALGTAVAVSFRADSMLLVAPIAPALALHGRIRERLTGWPRWPFALVVPIAVVVGWTLAYDQLRFGSPFNVGYDGAYDRLGFSTPPAAPRSRLVAPAPREVALRLRADPARRAARALVPRAHAPSADDRHCRALRRGWGSSPDGGHPRAGRRGGLGSSFRCARSSSFRSARSSSISAASVPCGARRGARCARMPCRGCGGGAVGVGRGSVQSVFHAIGCAGQASPCPTRSMPRDTTDTCASAHWAALYWFRNGPTVFGVAMLLIAVAGCGAAITLGFAPTVAGRARVSR